MPHGITEIHRLAISRRACAMFIFVSVILVGCSTVPAPRPPHLASAARSKPQNRPSEHKSGPAPHPTPRARLYPGTGIFIHRSAAFVRRPVAMNAHGQISLDFVDANIQDVAKAILGDYLKLNYAIAGNVKGTVTIQTSQPLDRHQVLLLLEQTLRQVGVALVHSHGVYRVVTLQDAEKFAHHLTISGAKAPSADGYGSVIVPLHYIDANHMAKLLDTLAAGQGQVTADPARNLLVITGTHDERSSLIEDIHLFDTNWLSGMSFAMFTPRYTDADELTKELEQIIGGLHGPLGGIVRFIPIDRLNAVLAISPQLRYLEEVRAWVDRLDHPGKGTKDQLYVYRVQNGRASDLAATLRRVFGESSGSGGPRGDRLDTLSSGSSSQDGTLSTLTAKLPPTVYGAAMSSSGMAGVRITADKTNNSLVILATPVEFTAIRQALEQLDVAPREVFLEAAIAEITLTNDTQYGVQYYFQPNNTNQAVLSNSNSSVISSTFPGFSYVFTNGNNIKVILDALASITHVKVVSSPQVLVLNNQTATLQVGNRVPVVTQQAVSTLTTGAPLVNSVQYEDTGVILKVTPRVNSGGLVMMDISQEVSDVTKTTTSDINSPTIEQRKITTSVAVRDGETVALGGLISSSVTNGRSGIPWLQNIPFLGNLFRDTQHSTTRTELMVLITPHVVDNMEKARAITAELARKLPAVEALFDKQH